LLHGSWCAKAIEGGVETEPGVHYKTLALLIFIVGQQLSGISFVQSAGGASLKCMECNSNNILFSFVCLQETSFVFT